MKLVINRCYGGFSLSPKAVARLAELQGKPCHFFTSSIHGARKPLTLEEAEKEFMWSAYTVPNPDEVAGNQGANWHSMTMEERGASNARWEAISLDCRPANRADPLLVQVVEELGDAADGQCAELAIVEIPDDVSWEIDEYDGMERVDEVHRSWS